MTRGFAAFGIWLALTAPAWAGPITYSVTYTAGASTGIAGQPVAPDFSFSFTLPERPLPTVMYDLDLVTFETGLASGPQAFDAAGTNDRGWWVFSSGGSGSIGADRMGCHYLDGPCLMFEPDATGAQGSSWGQTLWFMDPTLVARLDGSMTVTPAEEPLLAFASLAWVDEAPLVRTVPDAGSTLLLMGVLFPVWVGYGAYRFYRLAKYRD